MVEREAVFEERQFQLRGLLDLLKLPRRLAVLGLHGLGWNQGIDKRCSIRSLQGPWTLDLGPWTLDLGPWTLDLGPWTLDLGPYHFLRDAWLVKKNYPWCEIRWKNSAGYVIGTPLCHPPLSARMFKFNIYVPLQHTLCPDFLHCCASDVYIEVVFKVSLQLPRTFPVPKLINRKEE